MSVDFKGVVSESHHCIDCGFDTAPGCPNRERAEEVIAEQLAAGIKLKSCCLSLKVSSRMEMYIVHDHVWRAAGMEPWGGCLCIGCLEKRIGRRLIPADFEPDHPFNEMPGTPRLLDRRGDFVDVLGDFPEELLEAAS